MSDLLTTTQLAARLHLDVRTVQRRMAAGRLGIPVIDISTNNRPSPRFRQSDVDRYLKSREIA